MWFEFFHKHHLVQFCCPGNFVLLQGLSGPQKQESVAYVLLDHQVIKLDICFCYCVDKK